MQPDFPTLLHNLFETGNFGHISLINFLINMAFVWVMVHFLYYKKTHRRDFYFTFLLIGIAIYFLVFFMIFVLEDLKGKTGIGIGIGLFGIFSIMRYRTDAMPVREMTYLFSIVCLSVINALGSEISLIEMLVPNVIVVVAMLLCEQFLLRSNLRSKLVLYDRVALIKPECRQQLLDDLHQRTGLNIRNVAIGSIDYMRDTAVLKIFFEATPEADDFDASLKIKREEWEHVDE